MLYQKKNVNLFICVYVKHLSCLTVLVHQPHINFNKTRIQRIRVLLVISEDSDVTDIHKDTLSYHARFQRTHDEDQIQRIKIKFRKSLIIHMSNTNPGRQRNTTIALTRPDKLHLHLHTFIHLADVLSKVTYKCTNENNRSI